MKLTRTQIFVLSLAFALVAAFIVSFVITLRSDTPRVTATVGNGPALPGVNSGKRVEVLNGSGRSGLARLATDQLRMAGFDVVYLGNAPKQAKSSVAFDRVGKIELARAVAKTLGIARAETSRDTTRLVEVSVILGTDWVPPGDKR
jgi:LytR cell envelope-related transcriptional attenuator